MSTFFIDSEFDGFGGRLLSMALVPLDRAAESLYLQVNDAHEVQDDWVRANVVPLIDLPLPDTVIRHRVARSEFSSVIGHYLSGLLRPHIVADWPDDIRYFCEALITGPGTMIKMPGFTTQLVRVDAYPTDLAGAVQHHAYWDAAALREILTNA